MLKRYFLATILCLAATSASALTIDLPTEPVAAGQLVQLTIQGVEPAMLSATKAFCWPEQETTFIPAKLWDNRPVIFFQAMRPGTYLIYVNTPIAGTDTTEDIKVVLRVGDGGPQPNPTPPPVPVPPGVRSMCVLVETQTRSAQEASMLGALRSYARTSGLTLRIVDQDTVDGLTQKTPTSLLPYLTALGKTPVPALVVLAPSPNQKASSVVAVKSLGGLSGAEAVALIKKWGG